MSLAKMSNALCHHFLVMAEIATMICLYAASVSWDLFKGLAQKAGIWQFPSPPPRDNFGGDISRWEMIAVVLMMEYPWISKVFDHMRTD